MPTKISKHHVPTHPPHPGQAKAKVKTEKKELTLREKARRAQLAIGPEAPKSSVIKALPKASPYRMSEEQTAAFVGQIRTKLVERKEQTRQKINAALPELKDASEERVMARLSQVNIEEERIAGLKREYEEAIASNQARAEHLMQLYDNKKDPYVVDTLVLGAGPNAVFVAGNYHQNVVDKHGTLYDPDGASALPTDVIYVGISSQATFTDKDLGLMGQEARFISPEILSRQPADYLPGNTIDTQRATIESFAKAIAVTKDHLKMPILEEKVKTIEVRDNTHPDWKIPECHYRVAVRNNFIYTNKIDIATGLGHPRTLPSNLFWNITKEEAYDPGKGKDGVAPVVIGQYCNSIEMPAHSKVVVMGGGGTAASNVDTLIHLRKVDLVCWMANTENGFKSVRAVGDWGIKLMDEIEQEDKKKVCKLMCISYQHDGTLNILVKDHNNNFSVLHADHLVASIGQEDRELRMLIKNIAGEKFDQLLPLYGYREIQEKDEKGQTVIKKIPITTTEELKGSEAQPIGIISQDGHIRILGAASRSGLGLKHKQPGESIPSDYDMYTHLADKVSQSKPLISAPVGGLSVSADSIRQVIRKEPVLSYDINTASPAQLMECLHDKRKVKWLIAKRSQLLPHPSGKGVVNGFISKEHLESVMKDDPQASHWVIDLTRLTFKNY